MYDVIYKYCRIERIAGGIVGYNMSVLPPVPCVRERIKDDSLKATISHYRVDG